MLNPDRCKAKDIMSKKVVSVKVDTPIYDAIKAMVKGNFSGMPVVHDDMTLAGIISEKDMLRLLYNFQVARGEIPTSSTVANFMTSNVLAVDHEESLAKVCDYLMNNPIRRVPVLAQRKLVGVISRADIIRYILEYISCGYEQGCK
jgi:CBS domain-containing protein